MLHHLKHPLWIAITCLSFLLMGRQTCFSQDSSLPVGVVKNLILRDNSRNRDVPIKIYYPRRKSPEERFPIIIFSHGAGGSKDGYGYLGKYWAGHGYVVIHIDHLGSDHALVKAGRPLLTLQAIKKAVLNPDNLMNRPLDISFVINSLPGIEDKVPDLKNRMDPTLIGVAGHSFGAYTAMAVAGATVHLANHAARSFQDNRVLCFIALSPQGTGTMGFDAGSWKPIRRPFLLMSGSQDRGLGGEPPQWRREAFQYLPPRHKFQIIAKGLTHMDFSDRQFNGSPVQQKYHGFAQKTTLLFWDSYLKNKGSYKELLKIKKGPNSISLGGVQASFQAK